MPLLPLNAVGKETERKRECSSNFIPIQIQNRIFFCFNLVTTYNFYLFLTKHFIPMGKKKKKKVHVAQATLQFHFELFWIPPKIEKNGSFIFI